MKVLVTGAAGQLGRDLTKLLGSSAVGLSHGELDVTDEGAVRRAIEAAAPDAIINAAAWTDVDGCEQDPKRAHRVNTVGARNVASAAAGAFVVQVSTDYVFDGRASRPYAEDDPTNPLSVYGSTKLEAEREVAARAGRWAVVRTAWLYSAGTKNFVGSIIRAARSRERLSVVADQHGSPTSTRDLAPALLTVIERGASGVLHGVNAGVCSRFEMAQVILAEAGDDPGRVEPVATDAMPRPAKRPAYAPLEPRAWMRAGLPSLRHWREALSAIIPEVVAALDAEQRGRRA